MAPRTIYLRSYDIYNEFLEYNLPDGRFAVITRSHFETLAAPRAFGAFTREGSRVAGVFASPAGPVVFLDSQQITARFGCTTATIDPAVGDATQQFTLTHDGPEGRINLTLSYRERPGLGANPYDTEPEDVDLLAMIASGLRREQFFRAYTRDYTT